MKYTPIDQIKISLELNDVIPVGILALREGNIYFEYDSAILKEGLEISPFKCPLRSGVQTFDNFLFEGLPGVFNDSLPDGWGRLLLDRQNRQQGIMPGQLSPLDRLAHVGNTGMGALVYEPDHGEKAFENILNLDQLASYANEVLVGEAPDVLQELLALNGSSAGARPKAMIGVDKKKHKIIHGTHQLRKGFEPWLVKFPNMLDGVDSGAIEYAYALMAIDAGLCMTEVHLFPGKHSPGYFATKRFDREGNQRQHTHSVSGLLHSDFRISSLDYEDLLAMTMQLTRDIQEVYKMFRLAVFNVLGHNRDDHAKNFSFIMDAKGQWRLSPSYDLTFSSGPRGEQSTMVMGEGKQLTVEHLIKLGLDAKLQPKKIDAIINATQAALSNWRSHASLHGVSKLNIDLIAKKIDKCLG